jgi:hypothetical protein
VSLTRQLRDRASPSPSTCGPLKHLSCSSYSVLVIRGHLSNVISNDGMP